MLAIQPSRNRLTDFYKFGKSFDTVQAKTQTASVFTCVFFSTIPTGTEFLVV